MITIASAETLYIAIATVIAMARGGEIIRGRPKPDVSPPPQASHDQN